MFQADSQLVTFLLVQLGWCLDADIFLINHDDTFALAVMLLHRLFTQLTAVVAVVFIVVILALDLVVDSLVRVRSDCMLVMTSCPWVLLFIVVLLFGTLNDVYLGAIVALDWPTVTTVGRRPPKQVTSRAVTVEIARCKKSSLVIKEL